MAPSRPALIGGMDVGAGGDEAPPGADPRRRGCPAAKEPDREEGYRVSTSTYLLDLDRIKELAPELLVCDIMFASDSKGWPFLTMARLDRQLCRVPILLCTAAVSTVEPLRDHLAAQGIAVVYKPFDLDVLLAAMDRLLRGGRGAGREPGVGGG